MNKLTGLQPQPLWGFFGEICRIPRPSKKEDKIREFLLDFAGNLNLPSKTDKAGNLIITKPASEGREGAPVVILQTHMDMVGEKNSDKIHDFEYDPIEPVVDGDWIRANGTTLGADCGIGIASQMAVLSSDTINHGPLECLFTVDEETGLTGAFALEEGFMEGKILLNLDSEDEGELFIGCAGGIDTIASFKIHAEEFPPGFGSFKISVTGLQGGHSGDDIDKGRGNANKILARFLRNVSLEMELRLAEFNGGNLRNAIAREAFALIAIPLGFEGQFKNEFLRYTDEMKFEYQYTDPGLKISLEGISPVISVIDAFALEQLLNSLVACPHGVLEMSSRMEGMVETSTNLASVKFQGAGKIVVTTSQRSEIESRKMMAAGMVESVFKLAGAEVEHTDGYPGWTPDPDSGILRLTVSSYTKLFGVEPVVRSIHAGLECGLFKKKYPGLDMVSFGPTIKGAHSPDERLNISSTRKFWKHLVDILENVR